MSSEETLKEARRVARELLGPASAELLSGAESQALCLFRIREGMRLEDAVFSIVFDSASTERELANEFIAYFLAELLDSGRGLLADSLERYLSTNDLVQSVFTDFWNDMDHFEFQGRAQFRSFMTRKMRWKASAYRRSGTWSDARDGRRLEADGVLEGQSTEAASPLSNLVRDEEREALALAILRLEPRDREMLRMHLLGSGHAELGRHFELTPGATRTALSRALRRAREIASRGNRES